MPTLGTNIIFYELLKNIWAKNLLFVSSDPHSEFQCTVKQPKKDHFYRVVQCAKSEKVLLYLPEMSVLHEKLHTQLVEIISKLN